MTGSTNEQCLFFLFGHGANGKSVFLETIQALLGDYGLNSRVETLMVKRHADIPNDVARLAGARFVAINETAEGQKLNEPLVKDMTGCDTLTARFMRREFFDFQPSFKLWMRGNHKPTITGTDYGIWRRIRLIPFGVIIPEKDRDPDLIAKLKEEFPGILAWAVEGCVMWQKHGLDPPREVTDAVSEYRVEMDILGQFLEDCCTVRDNAQVTAKALYRTYKKWADDAGEGAVSQKQFGLAMNERGFTKTRRGKGVIYHGLELVVEADWRDEGEQW